MIWLSGTGVPPVPLFIWLSGTGVHHSGTGVPPVTSPFTGLARIRPQPTALIKPRIFFGRFRQPLILWVVPHIVPFLFQLLLIAKDAILALILPNGAALLAKKTGNPMMPFVVECARFWTVGSWDRLQIPKPFTRAKLIIDKPIYVEADADEERLNEKLRELQLSLDTMVEAGAKWRSSI